MIREELLASIELIDDYSRESEMAVIEAMVLDFEKYTIMMESYDDTSEEFDNVFQEGSILDRVKKEGKKDKNKLITILKFIPRIVIAIFDSIKKKFKDADLGNKIKESGKKLNEDRDKKAKVEAINKEFEGKAECYIDEKTGKIKFKKDKKSVIAKVTYLMVLTTATANLFKRIQKEFDYDNPSKIRSFIDDIDKLIHGNKEGLTAGDIFDGGFEALGDAIKHITSLTGEFALISAGIENTANEIRMRLMADTKEHPKMEEALKATTELTEKMTNLSGIITATLGSVSLVTEFAQIVGGTISSVVDKIRGDNDLDERALASFKADQDYMTALREKYPRPGAKDRDGKWHYSQTEEEYERSLDTFIRGDVFEFEKRKRAIKRADKDAERRAADEERARAKEEYKRKKEEWRKPDDSDSEGSDT